MGGVETSLGLARVGGYESVLKMDGAGDSPAPVGDRMCLSWRRIVAAAILAAIEGGILAPGSDALKRKCLPKSRAISTGQGIC